MAKIQVGKGDYNFQIVRFHTRTEDREKAFRKSEPSSFFICSKSFIEV